MHLPLPPRMTTGMTAYLFSHERHQHPVGHGFFHTASVGAGDGPRFEYVYDCGAKKSKAALAPAVVAYSASLSGPTVDLLVLSHFHADHVNGLDMLFGRKQIDTAIIPYVSAAERLLLVAQLLTKADAGFDEVVLAATPEVWLRARGVTRVITIMSTGEPPLAPDDDERAPETHETPALAGGWQLRSGIETGNVLTDGESVGDNTPVILTRDGHGAWEFLFFCWNAKEQADRFGEAIKAVAKKSPEELLDPKLLPSTLHNSRIRKQIIECYAEVAADGLNWTTLCLRAGPAGTGTDPISYVARMGTAHAPLQVGSRFDAAPSGALAWLGTGDLELAESVVSDSFFAHYNKRGPVRTLSLPHHGSRKNFDADLLSHFQPSLVVATCPVDSHHHPDETVVRALAVAGKLFVKVDDSIESQVHESARFWVVKA